MSKNADKLTGKIDQKWVIFWDQVWKRVVAFIDVAHTIAIQLFGYIGGLLMVALSSTLAWSLKRESSARKFFPVFLIRAALGLLLAGIISLVAIFFVLTAGSIFSILGFRNIGEYTLKEQGSAWFIMIALVFAAPFFLSEYAMFQVCLIFAYAVGVIGVDFLFGQCGILSLGHAGFMILGGYMLTWLYNGAFGYEFPIYPAIALAALSMFFVGGLLGFPFLRVKDLYLSIITMAFTLAVPKILTSKYLAELSGHRDGGIFLKENSAGLLSTWISSPTQSYLVIVTVSLILIFIAYNLTHNSQIGRAFKAIACDDEISMIVGVPVVKYKLLAFALSGVYAGFSGALLIYASRFVSHEAFSLSTSIDMIAANIVGGPGRLLGSFLGGIYLTSEIPIIAWMGQTIPRGDALARAFYGLVPVIIIFFLPRGLAGEASRGLRTLFFQSRIRRGVHHVSPPPDYDLLEAKRQSLTVKGPV